jgi:hypothetical protein
MLVNLQVDLIGFPAITVPRECGISDKGFTKYSTGIV